MEVIIPEKRMLINDKFFVLETSVVDENDVQNFY